MKLSSSLLVLGLSLFLMLGASGCFWSHPSDINAFLRPDEVAVSAKKYVLQPPDEIEVHCTRVPEIHLQKQRIRPDGNVTFEGLGDVFVAGKTPAEVADLLKEKVSKLYILPGNKPIDVRISSFQSKYYYVLGQAYAPGKKLYTGRDSVLSVVEEA
jgi:protein involved in polysaccharide export with SLBB domain